MTLIKSDEGIESVAKGFRLVDPLAQRPRMGDNLLNIQGNLFEHHILLKAISNPREIFYE